MAHMDPYVSVSRGQYSNFNVGSQILQSSGPFAGNGGHNIIATSAGPQAQSSLDFLPLDPSSQAPRSFKTEGAGQPNVVQVQSGGLQTQGSISAGYSATMQGGTMQTTVTKTEQASSGLYVRGGLQQDAEKLFDYMDSNQSGMVSREEFMEAMSKMSGYLETGSSGWKEETQVSSSGYQARSQYEIMGAYNQQGALSADEVQRLYEGATDIQSMGQALLQERIVGAEGGNVLVEKVMESNQKIIKETERIINKPEIIERIIEVPKTEYKKTTYQGPPQVQYQEEIIEVPQIVEEERVIHVPGKKQIQERLIEVPVVQWVERIEYDDYVEYREVPVDKVIEVPEIEYVVKEVEHLVPQTYVQEYFVDKYKDVPVTQVQEVERIETIPVYVPPDFSRGNVQAPAQPYSAPAPAPAPIALPQPAPVPAPVPVALPAAPPVQTYQVQTSQVMQQPAISYTNVTQSQSYGGVSFGSTVIQQPQAAYASYGTYEPTKVLPQSISHQTVVPQTVIAGSAIPQSLPQSKGAMDLFDMLDKNKSGTISREEFEQAMGGSMISVSGGTGMASVAAPTVVQSVPAGTVFQQGGSPTPPTSGLFSTMSGILGLNKE
eukprot:TRINITY_DN43271_c0_g1_i1.p1 TRINITY_DN43271_c0_g1~~TRINITY_DN43271_c0_g1_i1.p1  ORF type:complete len:628 (+),score=98.85 TRINITY_DN43271_c0_g1_i1:75-1886(+)